MSDRAKALHVLAALKRSPVGDSAVLVGFSDAGAEGYASVLKQAEVGLEQLLTLLDRTHD
jgi:hypothetical protein